VGLDGVALTDLRPAGAAQFGVERVDVVTEGEYLAQGTPVRVVRNEGYRHVVRGLA
jgi:membrane-bound serine protease (ClpP class)